MGCARLAGSRTRLIHTAANTAARRYRIVTGLILNCGIEREREVIEYFIRSLRVCVGAYTPGSEVVDDQRKLTMKRRSCLAF